MKPKVSLQQLFSALLSPIQTKEFTTLPDEPLVTTTIRLEPHVRKYYDEIAKELGVSFQSVITMSLTGLMKVSQSNNKTETNLMIERFHELFQAYSIPTLDIPEIFKQFNLRLSDLSNNDRLLDFFSNEVFQFTAKLFNVNIDWLKGTSDTCVRLERVWYKATKYFCTRLNQISKSSPKVFFITDSDQEQLYNDRKNKLRNSQMGIILKTEESFGNGKTYDKYHLYEFGPWGYDITRINLKVIMMFCLRNQFSCEGMVLDTNTFIDLFNGQLLPISILTNNSFDRFAPGNYVSAGNYGDTDLDELLEVVRHYAYYDDVHNSCDLKSNRSYNIYSNLAFDLSKFDLKETKSIKSLLSKEQLESLEEDYMLG